jgi:glycosyltransferase involved in cell wall biosynthesis
MPSDRIRIAFIHQPLSDIRPPVSLTGVADSIGLIIDEVARRLAQSHEVIEYCVFHRGQKVVEQFDGVEYRRVSKFFDRFSNRIMREIDRAGWRDTRRPFFTSELCYRQFISGVIADLSLQNCDIVHIFNFSQFVPLVRARLPKAQIVLHMQCPWLEQFDKAMIEQRIKAANLVLGCSDYIAAGVRRRFPSLAQRCRHIYNGVDIALFSNPHGVQRRPKQILFVGRLSPEKGVHVLLDAFRIVLAHHPDAHLDLIGPEIVPISEMFIPGCDDPHLLALAPYYRPGAYAELLHAKVSELPSGSVSFFNKGMPFIELVPHYHSASVFAFPSVWEEPFGMPLVEAMAAHTPVVATRGGAFPEIIGDGKSGLLVERSDVQGLANAILHLLDNPAKREAMGQAAYERASLFDWDRITEVLLKEYERLLYD